MAVNPALTADKKDGMVFSGSLFGAPRWAM
jgi:hypothetical protein